MKGRQSRPPFLSTMIDEVCMAVWRLQNRKADFQAIRDELGLDPVTIRLLCNRYINTPDAARRFLYPECKDLHSPFLMKGMEQACNMIHATIASGGKIRVIGDYDADGVFSTYILYDVLSELNAKVDYRIPDRVRDGYGINDRLVREAAEDGVALVLTCDNGISAVEQIALAYELGMQVIVTDHHEIPQVLPCAEVILNPKLTDCGYPFRELCGAGVAMKLAVALGADPYKYLAFATVATICDIVTLLEENRVIVKLGMQELHRCNNLGLRALAEGNQLRMSAINTGDIGYRIGPCINAGGRLASAELAMRLLLSPDEQTAQMLAGQLISLNEERKTKTQEAVDAAIKQIENNGGPEDKVLVLLLKECHESVAGIVAGKIKENYNRPTIVLTYGQECVKGSARSTEYYNMVEGLRACSDILLHFGGHPMAAGLSIQEENVALLRQRLNESAQVTEEDLQGKLAIDLVVPFAYVTEERIDEIGLLAPFGPGNPSPVFAVRNVSVIGAQRLGREKSFMKFFLQDEEGSKIEALCFADVEKMQQELTNAYGKEEYDKMMQRKPNRIRLSIAYDMDINEYMGVRTPQLIIRDYMI